MPRALIVEDSADTRQGLEQWLSEHDFEVASAAGLAEARRSSVGDGFELILLDVELPDGNGLDLLDELDAERGTQVIVITGHASKDSAVEAFRRGAVDYLEKPVDLERLERIVARVSRTAAGRREVRSLERSARDSGVFGSLVGRSPVMLQMYELVTRVAPTSSTVLVLGETGTGKELVARTIHELSPRTDRPFVAVNCGAIPPSLIESELFGHERGSFTGADRRREGIFERADGGTLFLDEISEMSLDLQVRLLRVLENRTVTRVGSSKSLKVDVRLIAASNQDLAGAVTREAFREDLFYRLNVFPIRVPPLRDREGDVELLARHLLEQINQTGGTAQRISDPALRRLAAHAWPGNVRELRNVLERASIVSTDEIEPAAMLLDARDSPPLTPAGDRIEVPLGASIAEVERKLILETLRRLDGDKRKAAAVLGVSLKTLYNRLKSYGES